MLVTAKTLTSLRNELVEILKKFKHQEIQELRDRVSRLESYIERQGEMWSEINNDLTGPRGADHETPPIENAPPFPEVDEGEAER